MRNLLLSVSPDDGNITRRPDYSHCRDDTGSDETEINGIMLMVAATAFGICTNQWEAICMPYDHTSVLIPNCLQAMNSCQWFHINLKHTGRIFKEINRHLPATLCKKVGASSGAAFPSDFLRLLLRTIAHTYLIEYWF